VAAVIAIDVRWRLAKIPRTVNASARQRTAPQRRRDCLANDKGISMQRLEPEILTEPMESRASLGCDNRGMAQTRDRRTKTIPSVATFHARERSRKTPAA
jgi:hypothetical protein